MESSGPNSLREDVQDGASRPPEWSLSTIFPEELGWNFGTENTGLRQYRLSRSGCEKVECHYSAQDQDHHQATSKPPKHPFAASDPQEGPVAHVLTCGSWGYSKKDPFKMSREVTDKVGHDWGFPSKLFEQFHVSPHLIAITHLIEYDLGRRESITSSADLPFPRFINFAIADFGYGDNWYLCILRHDIVTQVTACFFIYHKRPELQSLFFHLQDNTDDILMNPITLLWIIMKQHVLSYYNLKKRSSLSWRSIHELRAKLDIVPDENRLAERKYATKEKDYKALTAELYEVSQNAYERKAYFMASANNVKRIVQINRIIHNAQQGITGYSESKRLLLRTVYMQLDERLTVITNDFEYRVNELRTCAAILQSQFSVLYNMINQRDNQLSFVQAESSREIAEAMRYDGTSMKTIAVVALVFIPATFVSTVFATTLFNFKDSTKLWWVYLLLCIVSTGITLAAWFCYMARWRKKEAIRNANAGDVEARIARNELRFQRSQAIPLENPDRNQG